MPNVQSHFVQTSDLCESALCIVYFFKKIYPYIFQHLL